MTGVRLFARACVLLLASVLPIVGGCTRRPLTGPPELRLGRDECGECGMLIGEDRCSSALLVERAGERLHVPFDDVGCMLDYERAHAGDLTVLERYVHDFDTGRWIPAASAVYLHADSDHLRTPMGSGIAAFSDQGSAEVARSKSGGRLFSLQELRAAHRDSMLARRAGG